MIAEILTCLVVGYCFGCFSTGYVVGKKNNVNITQHGSGNSGATNALRTLGKKAGAITLAGDMLKTMLPILILRMFVFKDGEAGWHLVTLYTGLGAVIGHNFPFWMGFHGGKGIASTGAVIIMLNPTWLTLILAVLFFGLVAITRYVSVGSLVVSSAFPVFVYFMYSDNVNRIHMVIVCCIFTILAFYKHRGNIVRLVKGTENKIGSKK